MKTCITNFWGELEVKKILMTASVYSHIYNFHFPYLDEFKKLGWETHVCCAEAISDSPCIDKAVDLPFKKKVVSICNLKAIFMLRKIIKIEQYDLIVTHTTLASMFTRLAVIGIKERPKMINVIHGFLFDDNSFFIKRYLMMLTERLTSCRHDLFVVMNDCDYNIAKRIFPHGRIERIPGMGVDYSRFRVNTGRNKFELRKENGIPCNSIVLLCVAELSERKSQRVLIEAMPSLPSNVVLVLCGEGKLMRKYKSIAEKLKVKERVFFLGHVNNIADWYRMSDICVAASRIEGLPFNIIEAMYFGLPVVASQIKGHVDLVSQGRNGLLYQYGNIEEYVKCVNKIIESDILRLKICENNIKDAKTFSLTNVMPKVMGLYLSKFD